jgi:hypothetical protein
LGLPDAQEYANQLKKAEKMKEVQQAVCFYIHFFNIIINLITNFICKKIQNITLLFLVIKIKNIYI